MTIRELSLSIPQRDPLIDTHSEEKNMLHTSEEFYSDFYHFVHTLQDTFSTRLEEYTTHQQLHQFTKEHTHIPPNKDYIPQYDGIKNLWENKPWQGWAKSLRDFTGISPKNFHIDRLEWSNKEKDVQMLIDAILYLFKRDTTHSPDVSELYAEALHISRLSQILLEIKEVRPDIAEKIKERILLEQSNC